MKKFVRERVRSVLTHDVVVPLQAASSEVVFQNVFAQQCANLGLKNDFYPVGAAASYSLMYLLVRLLSENDFQSIVELGSGQSTILVDRLKKPDATHVCYEDSKTWHDHLRGRLKGCDYRHRPLTRQTVAGVDTLFYESAPAERFDLLLVDGPGGVDRHSRIGCLKLVEGNDARDFVVVMDDAGRPGERETIGILLDTLSRRGVEHKWNELRGRTFQTVIAAGRYQHVCYYF